MIKVTVITPCYNPGGYLQAMLESVNAQGAFVSRHIVMDGGSTDGTVEALRDWSRNHPNFEFVSEKDDGQSDACRKALELVNTEYFYWLNADDVMLPDSIRHLTQGLNLREPPAMVYGDYFRIDGNGHVFAKRRQPSYNYWNCLHGYITVQNVAAIFNTRMLRDLGGFDVSLRFAMDYDIILKLGKLGPVKHVKQFCGAFRIHAASKTTTIDDVCRTESEALRTRYGVTQFSFLRKVQYRIAQMDVLRRMICEGCLNGRLYNKR